MKQVGTTLLSPVERCAIGDLVRRGLLRRKWGQRRARLPGRRRLRELAANPAAAAAALRVTALRRAAVARPDGRMVGILMVRDEDDVLDDMLRCAVQWFDRILVLDGTEDTARRRRTIEVLSSFSEVVHVAHDADVLGGQPTRDGARQVLLDEVRRRYGTDQWIGVLHADEFMDQDPRPMLAAHNPLLDPTIRVRLVHAFLHTADEAAWRADPIRYLARPIRDRVSHVMWPGVPETRFFFDRGLRDYQLDHHSKTVPVSFRAGPLVDGFSVIQYNERSPDQALERARSRAATGWQTGHYDRLTGAVPRVFVDTLDTEDTPFAPEFRNDPDGPFRPMLSTDVPLGPLPSDFDTDPNHPLVALAHHPSRRGTLRWWATARRAARPVDTMLVDHTARLVSSTRLDAAQRLRVAAEFLALIDRSTRP